MRIIKILILLYPTYTSLTQAQQVIFIETLVLRDFRILRLHNYTVDFMIQF